jgi:hypothetical protein
MGTSFKDFIGSKDLRLWDGITRTFSRLTSTGGTLTNNKLGSVVDILAVYGSHDTYTDATLQSAISSIGSNVCTILFQPGTWTIANNVTIPSNISIMVPQGATLSVSTGKTLTISGTIIAGVYVIFDGAGTIAGSPILDFKNAYWFSGTVTDSTTPTYKVMTGGADVFTSVSTDTINEQTAAAGVTVDGVKLKDSEPYCDVINEKTANTGVTVDGVLLKDTAVRANTLESTVSTGTAPLTVASTTKVTNFTAEALSDGTNRILTKIINIGDWNMDTTETVNIAHGLTMGDIRSVTAIVRPDNGTPLYVLSTGYVDTPAEIEAFINSIDATNVNIKRRTGGVYDNANFDATSYNRGWITITYVV